MGDDLEPLPLPRHGALAGGHPVSAHRPLHRLAVRLLGRHGDPPPVTRDMEDLSEFPKYYVEIFRKQLAEDKDLVTSIRWLSADKKNGFVNVCLKMLIKVGLAKPGEDLDADSLKTKLVFALCQMVRVDNSICIDDSNNIMSLALHSDHHHPHPLPLQQLPPQLCILDLHLRLGNLEWSELLHRGT